MDFETQNWFWLEQILIKSPFTYQENFNKAKLVPASMGTLNEDQIRENCINYLVDSKRYIHLPQMMPGSDRVRKLYERMTDSYSLNQATITNFEDEYINEDTSDPHVMKSLLRFNEILVDQGVDPFDHTTYLGSFGDFLVVVDAGLGQELSWMIKNIPHNFLVLALPSINHLSSSFKHINWTETWNNYCKEDGKSITFLLFDENNKTSEGLIGSLSNQSITGLDHSVVFYSSNPDEKTREILTTALCQDRKDMPINYLGFAMDEYNMLWHSWHSLLTEPKVFAAPSKKLNLPALVVGSGPSLDKDIEKIKQISDSHIIIAAASSSYSLLKNGIEPDFLILLERGTHEVDNYTKLKSDYPNIKTRLIACVSCASKLHELFDESAIYFRPGSTPSTLFSPAPINVVDYEGPQTVNTAVSVALRITTGDILLMGIDLGTTSLDNPRSKDAVGISPRDFNLVEQGNFSSKVYTERELLDGAIAMQDCIKAVGQGRVSVFNASNGLKIGNTTPIKIDEYIISLGKKMHSSNKSIVLKDFWNGLKTYETKEMIMRWTASEPRKQIMDVTTKLENIFSQDPDAWFNNSGKQLTDCLSATSYMRKQFVARMYRGAILKSSLAMKRTMNVLRKDTEKQHAFYYESSKYMRDLVVSMQNEVFRMCDDLEAHFYLQTTKN